MDYRHAVYAGSFDPITLGHTSIIERAARLFDRVSVGVGHNHKKKGLLPVQQRLELIERSVAHLGNVDVHAFSGLLVDDCRAQGAGVIVRGMRLLTDFEHEFQLGLANRDLAPDIETVFLFTNAEQVYVSSSLAKEIARNGGDTSRYVSPEVAKVLRAALCRTGDMAPGKC